MGYGTQSPTGKGQWMASYESPELIIIGSVEELTLVNKDFGNADSGIMFQNQTTSIVAP